MRQRGGSNAAGTGLPITNWIAA